MSELLLLLVKPLGETLLMVGASLSFFLPY